MAFGCVVMSLFLALLAPASANLRASKGQQESCKCLEWKEAYAHYGVRCGRGGEIVSLTTLLEQGRDLGDSGIPFQGPAPVMQEWMWEAVQAAGEDKTEFVKMIGGVGKAICEDFFMTIPDNFCVNRDWYGQSGNSSNQWCYVSSACAEAQRIVGTTAAVKTCGEGDRKLADMSFEDILELHKVIGLNPVMMSRYAFKTFDGERYTLHAAAQWGELGKPIIEDKDIGIEPDKKVLITENWNFPYHLVQGKTLYEVGVRRTTSEGKVDFKWFENLNKYLPKFSTAPAPEEGDQGLVMACMHGCPKQETL